MAQRWQAIAVGDSCFFQVRDNRLHKAFPLERAKDFGDSPWLVGSRPMSGGTIEKRTVQGEGTWCTGDRFWLMTDALAQWFLQQVEMGNKPWQAMETLMAEPAPKPAFVSWIEEIRNRQELRNDDVTLMRVEL